MLSNMIAIYALVMGLWGLFNFIRKQAPDGSYNAALAIAVGLFVLEGVVGVFLVLFGYQPARATPLPLWGHDCHHDPGHIRVYAQAAILCVSRYFMA